MNSMVVFIFTITCCLLVNQQQASDVTLPKPILKLVTEDPGNVIKGDTIKLKCIGSGDSFQMVHKKPNGKNDTLEESTGEFLLKSIQNEQNGDYFCKYCKQKVCSEFSSPLNIYVHDKYPRPYIIVSPRRVVQPGATVTITCKTQYSSVEFLLLKDNKIFKNESNDGNQFSYVINNATQDNGGDYSCIFKSRTSGMQSVRSNTMKISVLELPGPLMSLEEDPNNTRMLRINCTAPGTHDYDHYLFTLLDDSKVIEGDVRAVDGTAIFTIPKPKYNARRFRCMYRVKYSFDFADSFYSIREIKSNGVYVLVIRHTLSALILILLGIILLLHFKHEEPPDLPATSARYKKQTELVEIADDG